MTQNRTAPSITNRLNSGWKRWIPRILTVAVGIILLAAGLLKSTEMGLFVRQIRAFEILSHQGLLVMTAWGLIIAECVLGTALILRFLPKISIPLSVLLFLVFIGATAWAWVTGVSEDCGCFGSWVRRTLGEAMIEDIAIIAALGTAWGGLRNSQEPPTRAKILTLAAACLAGLLLPLFFGLPQFSNGGSSQEKGIYIGQEISEVRGLDSMDLRRGTYLIVLIQTDCSHCHEAVIDLNFLMEEEGTAKLVALCPNDKAQIMKFREDFQPIFPIGQITEKAFWRLVGEGDVPRTILVNNQNEVKVWDREIPEMQDVREALNPLS